MKQKSTTLNVFIFDCEYFYKTSNMPNIKAMKLSSYHKQKGDRVIMLDSKEFITSQYDVVYMIKEYNATPFPPSHLFDDKRGRLLGAAFESFEGFYNMPPYVAAVRPDYTLYEGDTKWHNACYVQFFCGFYKIDQMQDFRRETKNITRLTIVADENLWLFGKEAINDVLIRLQQEKNVWFQYPIPFKVLLSDESIMENFSKLNFAKRDKIKFLNNLGNSYENAIKIIDYLRSLKTKYKFLNISPPSFAIVTKDHWKKSEDALVDFERCMRIAAYAKRNEIRINFKYPKYRLATPVWGYFEFFRIWSTYHFKHCYLDALLKGTQQYFTFKPTYDIILNNVVYWGTGRVQMAVHLLTHYPDLMKETAFVTWGNNEDERKELINYDYIKEKEHEYSIF